MAKRIRRLFSAEFKLQAAQLVFEQSNSVADTTNAMGIYKSTMNKWGRQLKLKRKGISPKASSMTPEQIEIRELKKKIVQLEEHNEILKKATTLVMSDSLNNLHCSRNSVDALALNNCVMCSAFIAVAINISIIAQRCRQQNRSLAREANESSHGSAGAPTISNIVSNAKQVPLTRTSGNYLSFII